MRTKLYVLGAVLGVGPGLLPVVACAPEGLPSQEAKQDTRGASRKGRGGARVSPAPVEHKAGVVASPDARPAESVEPKHPCQLVTLIQVPCDPDVATCEYTYWECPQGVKPLRA